MNQPVLDPGVSGEGGDPMADLAGWQCGVFKTWLGVMAGVGRPAGWDVSRWQGLQMPLLGVSFLKRL